MTTLGPDTARIFRITHVHNVPWILQHGLHCKASKLVDPNFVPIGLPELIQKRATRAVPIGPGGNLSDYVPFYFTPWSVMMYNIHTGCNVPKRPNKEIVIFVSSLHKLKELGRPFLFTNAHAYLQEAEFFEDLADLPKIDWALLNTRNFARDPEDPGKVGRYQAEALVHEHVPIAALLGIACHDPATKASLEAQVQATGSNMEIRAIPEWYF